MDARARRTLKALAGEVASPSSMALLLLTALFFGWFPDGLTLLLSGSYRLGVLQLTISLAVVLVIAVIAYTYSRDVRYRIETVSGRTFRVLVLFLSEEDEDSIELYRKLDAPPRPEEGFRLLMERGRHRWEIPLRAVAYHLKSVERLVVVPSDISHAQAGDFVGLARKFFPHLSIRIWTPVNFEDIREIQRELEKIYETLRNEGIEEEEIVVDVTSGTKPVSIAGASATVTRTNRYFQYISTRTREVSVFNMELVDRD